MPAPPDSAQSTVAPQLAPLDALFADLGSGPEGLSESEAAGRLARFGENVLQAQHQVPEFVKFLRQFRNFFAILLIVGGFLAIVAEHLDPGQGNLYIAIALFAVVLLNAAFTYLQERQSERIMESFARMLPTMVSVMRGGTRQQREARELVPGDVIFLAEGDRVAADARLIDEHEMRVDVSSLTGESEPQRLDADAGHENLLESRNMVFSGALVHAGNGSAVVCATGMSTQIGHIVSLTKRTEATQSPIHRELAYFIKIISTIAIILGIVFFGLSVALGKGEIGSLIFAIGIIVANVPEGLLPTVTLALTMASKRIARRKALVRNLESVETLGSTTVICTDKTGTLTENRISVATALIGETHFAADDPSLPRHPDTGSSLAVMALCNNAQPDAESGGYTGDPTEAAMLRFVDGLQPLAEFAGFARVAEEPFSSESKRMITVCRTVDPADPPLMAYLKGAPEIVLDMCDRVRMDGEVLALTEKLRKAVLDNYTRLASRGERGIAMASRPVATETIPEDGYILCGLVGMIDPPRAEVPDAIARCRSAGIRVAMLTGDYGLTAEVIARKIGLFSGDGRVVNGEELGRMDDAELAEVLRHRELVFARISPAEKLQIVQAFKAQGEIVAVTGDGVNDAPALKHADIGVAMGVIGTEVAKEASDMVLMDDNFATIVAAVEEGRTIFENIKKFIAYILTSNIPEILPFIAYVLIDAPLALTVVLILSIDLGTDILPALGLGAEKPETDVMRKKPRPRDERLLSRNLLLMSYGVVGMIQAAAGFFSFFVILFAGGWSWGQELANDDLLYRTALTGFFASIIICQIADVIICRTRRQSIFTIGVFSNPLVWIGIVTELLLLTLISYVPAFNVFFGTAPLEIWQLALSVPFAILIVVGDETRRVFVRRGNPFVLRWLTW